MGRSLFLKSTPLAGTEDLPIPSFASQQNLQTKHRLPFRIAVGVGPIGQPDPLIEEALDGEEPSMGIVFHTTGL